MQLKITIDKYSEIKLYNLKGKIYLAIQQDKKVSFVEIPSSVTYELVENTLILNGSSEHKDYFMSFNVIKNSNKSLFGIQKRKIRIKGLGYKCSLNSDKSKLLLKVGNSHNTELSVPDYVTSFNILKD